MANYNTFSVIDCKSRKCVVLTSSARKAAGLLKTGVKIEIWNDNKLSKIVYAKNSDDMQPYIKLEKEYIARQQKRAEERNKRRKKRNVD